jgi:hypothetical protein
MSAHHRWHVYRLQEKAISSSMTLHDMQDCAARVHTSSCLPPSALRPNTRSQAALTRACIIVKCSCSPSMKCIVRYLQLCMAGIVDRIQYGNVDRCAVLQPRPHARRGGVALSSASHRCSTASLQRVACHEIHALSRCHVDRMMRPCLFGAVAVDECCVPRCSRTSIAPSALASDVSSAHRSVC